MPRLDEGASYHDRRHTVVRPRGIHAAVIPSPPGLVPSYRDLIAVSIPPPSFRYEDSSIHIENHHFAKWIPDNRPRGRFPE